MLNVRMEITISKKMLPSCYIKEIDETIVQLERFQKLSKNEREIYKFAFKRREQRAKS